MCKVFKVSRSNYYDWLKRSEFKDLELETQIKEVFIESRETYGIKRIHAELIARGVNVGHNKVAKLKKKLNIYPKMRRKYKITTDSRHNNKVFDNILDRNFSSTVLSEKIVSDIT